MNMDEMFYILVSKLLWMVVDYECFMYTQYETNVVLYAIAVIHFSANIGM